MAGEGKNYFKGMIAGIIAAAAAVAFLVGFLVSGANSGKAVVASETDATTSSAEEVVETVKDSAGNEFVIPLKTDNVIALNKNATDMLTAIGKGDIVKGKSDDTKYPASASTLKSYGTSEKPDTDNIIAANPGAVIAPVSFAGTSDYTKLKDAGINVVCFDLDNADTTIEETGKLGLLFDSFDKASDFVADLENIKALVEDKKGGEKDVKVYWEKNDDYTSINKSANENKLLTVAGLRSITADKAESEVKTDSKFVKDQDPAVIVKTTDYDKNVLTLEKDDLKGAEDLVEEIKKRNEFDSISAVKDNKIVVLSDRITNTPLGTALAPLYMAKVAYPDKFKDVKPADYLNDFLNKYWTGSNFKGSLAYMGDISFEENKEENTVESGTSTGTSLADLSTTYGSSVSAGDVLRGSLLASSSSTEPASGGNLRDSLINSSTGNKNSSPQNTYRNTNTNTNNNTTPSGNKSSSGGNNNSKKKQNDTSTNDDTEVIDDSTGNEIIVNRNDGDTGVKSCIVFNSSIYEMIKIMGRANTVVGVAESLASSADFPELSGKATYGKWNEPNAEAIIQAKPDVVFAYANYGQEAMEKVRKAGITVVSYNFYIPSEINEEIIGLGKILGREALAREYVKDVSEIQNMIKSRTKSVSKLKCYWEGYTDYTSVAGGSGGDEIIALAGCSNVYTAGGGGTYPTISDEWILQKNPQVMVKMVSGTKFILGKTINDYTAASALYNTIVARPGWKDLSAVKNEKIIILNSSVGTTAFGCAVAPLMVAKVAYPEKFADINVDTYTKNFYKKYWGTELTGTWRYTHQKL